MALDTWDISARERQRIEAAARSIGRTDLLANPAHLKAALSSVASGNTAGFNQRQRNQAGAAAVIIARNSD